MSKESNSGGSGAFLLFVVFLVLKLTGTIDWSWWWVACPLWIPIAFSVGILLGTLFIGLLVAGFVKIFDS